MAFSLVAVASDLISDLGYGGLAIGLLADSFGVPIASEVLIPLAVVDTRTGRFDLPVVIVLSIAAQVLGAVVSYVIGRRLGTPAVARWGRYVLLSERDLERAQRVFARHGPWIAGVGRCAPVLRGVIGYPAGTAGMRAGPFVGWTTAGAVVWTGVLVTLGELWRTHVDSVDHLVDKVSYVVIALIVVALIWHVRHALRPHRASAATGAPPPTEPDQPEGEVRKGEPTAP